MVCEEMPGQALKIVPITKGEPVTPQATGFLPGFSPLEGLSPTKNVISVPSKSISRLRVRSGTTRNHPSLMNARRLNSISVLTRHPHPG